MSAGLAQSEAIRRVDWILAHGDPCDRKLRMLLEAYRNARTEEREALFAAVCARLFAAETRERVGFPAEWSEQP